MYIIYICPFSIENRKRIYILLYMYNKLCLKLSGKFHGKTNNFRHNYVGYVKICTGSLLNRKSKLGAGLEKPIAK